MRRATKFVRKVASTMGPIEAKRIQFTALAIPADGGTDFSSELRIPLLQCSETVDEELESDGTNTAQVPLYSKVVAMKLDFRAFTSSGGIYRWMVAKEPDGEQLASSLTDSFFHSSNDAPTGRELRSTTLAKGHFLHNGSSSNHAIRFFIKKSTLKRLGSLRENDVIAFYIASSLNTADSITGFGTIYCRLN